MTTSAPRPDLELVDLALQWSKTLPHAGHYIAALSPEQSCPDTHVMVDLTFTGETDDDGETVTEVERVRLSRVVEVNRRTGEVETVLAGRDMRSLLRIKTLQETQRKTEMLKEYIETTRESNRRFQEEIEGEKDKTSTE
jgi:hypothetical protein